MEKLASNILIIRGSREHCDEIVGRKFSLDRVFPDEEWDDVVDCEIKRKPMKTTVKFKSLDVPPKEWLARVAQKYPSMSFCMMWMNGDYNEAGIINAKSSSFDEDIYQIGDKQFRKFTRNYFKTNVNYDSM